ncbi:MAG TPA: CBS domain-containing protein [Longimicrobium sp.]
MTIRDILRGKGGEVVTIGPGAPVVEAMRTLVRHDIGALVVTERGAVRGILSERDVLRAGAVDVARLSAGHVRDLMTPDVVVAEPSAGIREVMDVMTERRIRHLPVVENGVLCGLVSIGDVVNALRQVTEDEVHYLQAYITGTPL